MVMQDTRILVTLTALGPSNLTPTATARDWHGDRWYLDESTTIARRRGLDDRYLDWTETLVQPIQTADSYDGDDYSMFDSLQQERAWNPTLNVGPEESLGDDKDKLGLIVQVI
jgi:hypothetical protein